MLKYDNLSRLSDAMPKAVKNYFNFTAINCIPSGADTLFFVRWLKEILQSLAFVILFDCATTKTTLGLALCVANGR